MLANSIAVLSFLLLILIRFTTIKNENSRPNIFGILLLLVGFGLMCLQINLNNSNKKRNDFLEQEIKTANLNSERNLIASRPIFKFIKSETKWSEEVESGVRVCVENQGCRAGTSDAVLLRTYKIKDMQIKGDMMEERNSDIYKNLVNEKINSETCCLNPSGGWISKQDSFILEVDVLYQDETTNKEYAEILKVFYDSHNEEFKQYLPSDIQAIYDEHRRK